MSDVQLKVTSKDAQVKITWKGMLALGLAVAFIYAASNTSPDALLDRLIKLAERIIRTGTP